MSTVNRHSHNCPKCGSQAIRRSRRNLIDRLLALANLKAYRCRECGRRFHLPVDSAVPQPPKEQARSESRKRRRALKRREILVYVMALAAFAVAAFVITREGG
jgi:predicted RNA-binding Zn-ribbon protein involved in translation (DUF1610 family)